MTSLRRRGASSPQPGYAHLAAVGQGQDNAKLVPALLLSHPPGLMPAPVRGRGNGPDVRLGSSRLPVPFSRDLHGHQCRAPGPARGAARAQRLDGSRAGRGRGRGHASGRPLDGVVLVLVLEHVAWRKTLRPLYSLSPARVYVVIQENARDGGRDHASREPVGTLRVIREAQLTLVPRADLITEMETLGYALWGQRRSGASRTESGWPASFSSAAISSGIRLRA